ncbi:MAG: DUF4493 domain-containing protein [Muribaculaceae bacterium]|nr:DUF4493 domain-containing protein [Muribaculaceae bacterium]
MKRNIFNTAAIAAGIITAGIISGCTDEVIMNNRGEGTLHLTASINADVTVVSRAAAEEELAEKTIIWISNAKGVVRTYNSLSEIPEEGLKLKADHYTAEGWAGDSVPASFTDRWFHGIQTFEITPGATTDINVVCRIANVVTSVNYEDGVDDVLSDYSFTIGHNGGKLTFEGRDDRKGYFMMSSYDKDLQWTLSGTLYNGQSFSTTGTVAGAKAATEYAFRVKHNTEVDPLGGAIITIEVDETTVDVSDNVTINMAPDIAGMGYDISAPQYFEPGQAATTSVYISAASSMKSVVIASESLSKLGINNPEVDLLQMTDAVAQEVEAANIHFQYIPDEDRDISNMKIMFNADALNSLPAGEHTFAISATDSNNKTAHATLTVILSALPVAPQATSISDIWATTAVLRGKIISEDAVPSVSYRRRGAAEWTVVNPEINGASFSVSLADLTPATVYEWMVTSGDYESEIQSFTTGTVEQLPNAGFEEWYTASDKALVPGVSGSPWWDTGNHGSAKMSKQVTTSDSSIKHGGQYSAKLASQFVGVGTIGAFAAGNIFIGEFLGTENTTKGILGWGRNFTSRPKALKGYIKYTPGAMGKYNTYAGTKNDAFDQGIIYIALLTDKTMSYKSYSGWPQIVATADINNYGFKSDADNVIAYGEKVYNEATDGSDMIEFYIPLDYYRTDIIPSNIIITASASRYGDYYSGAEGSVMYLDDLELVY